MEIELLVHFLREYKIEMLTWFAAELQKNKGREVYRYVEAYQKSTVDESP